MAKLSQEKEEWVRKKSELENLVNRKVDEIDKLMMHNKMQENRLDSGNAKVAVSK